MIKIIFSEFQGMSAGMMMRNSFNQHQPGIPNLHPMVHPPFMNFLPNNRPVYPYYFYQRSSPAVHQNYHMSGIVQDSHASGWANDDLKIMPGNYSRFLSSR